MTRGGDDTDGTHQSDATDGHRRADDTETHRSDELERTRRRLEDVAHLLSHDVKSPLGIARTYLDFAEETGSEEDFDAVRGRLERADAMLGELLAFARLDVEDLELERCRISTVARTVWERIETDEATLTMRDDVVVEADRTHLQHVFDQLLRNSVEHGGRAVEIDVGALEGGTGFTIVDDGPGIVDGMEETVFEAGYSTTENGTGLGLTTVRAIVEAHGWALSVRNESGNGNGERGGTRVEIRTRTAESATSVSSACEESEPGRGGE